MIPPSKHASATVLMAALVSVLAIAGLTLSLSNPSTNGAQTFIFPEPEDTWTYQDAVSQSNWQYYDEGEELGRQIAELCVAKDYSNIDYGLEVTKCCNWNCADTCAHPLGEDTCAERCEAKCRTFSSQMQSRHIVPR